MFCNSFKTIFVIVFIPLMSLNYLSLLTHLLHPIYGNISSLVFPVFLYQMHIVSRRTDLKLEEALIDHEGFAVLGFFIQVPLQKPEGIDTMSILKKHTLPILLSYYSCVGLTLTSEC